MPPIPCNCAWHVPLSRRGLRVVSPKVSSWITSALWSLHYGKLWFVCSSGCHNWFTLCSWSCCCYCHILSLLFSLANCKWFLSDHVMLSNDLEWCSHGNEHGDCLVTFNGWVVNGVWFTMVWVVILHSTNRSDVILKPSGHGSELNHQKYRFPLTSIVLTRPLFLVKPVLELQLRH